MLGKKARASGPFFVCARHGAKRQAWRTNAAAETHGQADTSRRGIVKRVGTVGTLDNRRAKADREVTRRWKSSGGPDDREPLAEQQLRRREAG